MRIQVLRLRVVQWLIPALTAGLVVLGAQWGEQQRPVKLVRDAGRRAVQRSRDALSGLMDRSPHPNMRVRTYRIVKTGIDPQVEAAADSAPAIVEGS